MIFKLASLLFLLSSYIQTVLSTVTITQPGSGSATQWDLPPSPIATQPRPSFPDWLRKAWPSGQPQHLFLLEAFPYFSTGIRDLSFHSFCRTLSWLCDTFIKLLYSCFAFRFPLTDGANFRARICISSLSLRHMGLYWVGSGEEWMIR